MVRATKRAEMAAALKKKRKVKAFLKAKQKAKKVSKAGLKRVKRTHPHRATSAKRIRVV